MKVFDRLSTDLLDDAIICPGHDYTLKNLEFASSLARYDNNFAQRLAEVRRLGSSPWGKWSEEKLTNIFLHTSDPRLQSLLGVSDRVSALRALRELKNRY